jgi:hypothetical protein
MTFDFGADAAGPIANARRLGAQLRVVDHFFDVTQPIRPVEETAAAERRRRAFWRIFGAGRARAVGTGKPAYSRAIARLAGSIPTGRGIAATLTFTRRLLFLACTGLTGILLIGILLTGILLTAARLPP